MIEKLVFVGMFYWFGIVCANAQVLTKYDKFELKEGELVWQNTYNYPGNSDSIRAAVVQMLKSKYYTFNVIRNEAGYNGELKHYKINCKKYGKTYFNTPRIYCDGDWAGKFILEIKDNAYRVTVYALFYETARMGSDYLRTERVVKGRYIDAVTKRSGSTFRKKELTHISLMSFSLKDEFGLESTVRVNN
ncbi:MAG: hypothetical protein JST48_09125 [Bacteroidetes bacterium]|nr:hypothetical protein [Bacteroidota bacterium]